MARGVSSAGQRFGAGAIVVALGAPLVIIGCGTTPRAGVSDPQVYTALHLQAAQAAAGTDDQTQSFVQDMQRYFAAKPKDYEANRRRMDLMLDSQQRRSGFFQAASAVTAADLTAALKNLPVTSGTGAAGTASTGASGTATSTSAGTSTGTGNAPAPTSGSGAAGPADPGGGAVSTGASTSGTASAGTRTVAVPTPSSDELAEYRKKLADVVAKLVDEQISGEVSDSPFDQLDRVSDFYAAYILKLLRLRGDARSQDAAALVKFLSKTYRERVKGPGGEDDPYAKPPAAGDASRVIVLYLQSHVYPGTLPNYMTGVRVEVLGATTREENGSTAPQPTGVWGNAIPEGSADSRTRSRGRKTSGPTGADLVKILRLHPTRNYDVDAAAFGESLRQALALSGHVTAPTEFADVNASASRNASLESERRQRFVSRIGKASSYADAPSHTFGWNFYPSNVLVVPTSPVAKALGWLIGVPREYDTRSYLEGGAHDCSVVLMVPRNLQSFTCRVSYVSARLDTDGGSGSSEKRIASDQTFTVVLPVWNPYELTAATVGVYDANPVMPEAIRRRDSLLSPQTRPEDAGSVSHTLGG